MAVKRGNIKSGGLGEFLTTLFWALFIALLVRTFLFQPFHIPSGSMEPNLLQGDYIITSKYSLGYGKYAADPIPFPVKDGRLFERAPQRGDVVVFRPEGMNKNFIKRLVGLPGDEVQITEGIVHINGQSVDMKRLDDVPRNLETGMSSVTELWQERFPEGHTHLIYDDEKNSPADNTTPYIIPAGYYFMMGDNRDHSGDSRMTVREGGAGLIPKEHIIGRAEFILLSATEEFSIIRPWTWYKLRANRFFVGLR